MMADTAAYNQNGADKNKTNILSEVENGEFVIRNGHDVGGLPESSSSSIRLCTLEWWSNHLHVLPVITAVYIVLSFFTTYGIAVSYGHVEPGFPYISYTGVNPPERGWFSQFVNIGAFLMSINIYVRFLILESIIFKNRLRSVSRLNIASLIFGCLSAFGLSMVANFQTVVMRPMHHTGAGLAFGFGFIYCWSQCVLTWKLRKAKECQHFTSLAYKQIIMSIILTAFLIIFGITKAIYKTGRRNGVGTKWDTLQVPYLFSTITEWLTALMGAAVFSLTFIPDFKKFKFVGPRVELKQEVESVESVTFITSNHGNIEEGIGTSSS